MNATLTIMERAWAALCFRTISFSLENGFVSPLAVASFDFERRKDDLGSRQAGVFRLTTVSKSYAAGLKMNRPGGACLKLGHQNPQ